MCSKLFEQHSSVSSAIYINRDGGWEEPNYLLQALKASLIPKEQLFKHFPVLPLQVFHFPGLGISHSD